MFVSNCLVTNIAVSAILKMAFMNLVLTWLTYTITIVVASIIYLLSLTVTALLRLLQRVQQYAFKLEKRFSRLLHSTLGLEQQHPSLTDLPPVSQKTYSEKYPSYDARYRVELSDGQYCNYRDYGHRSGKLIFLLSGCPFDSSQWTLIAQQLSSHGYYVLTMDFFGYGASDRVLEERVSSEAYAEQVIDLLDALDIVKPMTLCGYGLQGSVVAMKVAAENPERVSRLIMVSPGGLPLSSWNPLYTLDRLLKSDFFLAKHAAAMALTYSNLMCVAVPLFRKFVIGKLLKPTHLNASLSMFIVPHLIVKGVVKTDAVLNRWHRICKCISLQALITRDYQQGLAYQLHTFPWFGPIDKQTLSSVRNHPKKVLIMCSDADPLFSTSTLRQLQEKLPQSHTLVVKDTSHFMTYECPDQITEAIHQFMNINDSGVSLHLK